MEINQDVDYWMSDSSLSIAEEEMVGSSFYPMMNKTDESGEFYLGGLKFYFDNESKSYLSKKEDLGEPLVTIYADGSQIENVTSETAIAITEMMDIETEVAKELSQNGFTNIIVS